MIDFINRPPNSDGESTSDNAATPRNGATVTVSRDGTNATKVTAPAKPKPAPPNITRARANLDKLTFLVNSNDPRHKSEILSLINSIKADLAQPPINRFIGHTPQEGEEEHHEHPDHEHHFTDLVGDHHHHVGEHDHAAHLLEERDRLARIYAQHDNEKPR